MRSGFEPRPLVFLHAAQSVCESAPLCTARCQRSSAVASSQPVFSVLLRFVSTPDEKWVDICFALPKSHASPYKHVVVLICTTMGIIAP